MNHLKAFIAATVITALVACVMLVIGINAIRNSPPVSASTLSSNASVVTGNASANSDDVNQLRATINQYQQREKQYQQQLNDLNQQVDTLNQQLDEANQQVSQFTDIMQQLQQYGLIQIDANGTIRVRRGSR